MKKVRISSILISVAVMLFVFFIALNFYKKEPLYSYILDSKTPSVETDIPVKPQDFENIAVGVIPQPEADNIIEETFDNDIPEKSLTEKTIFYTKTGSKWHTGKNCRYLANSKEILEGDFNIVIEKGLTPCSGCAESDNPTETFSGQKKDTDICYYTESGTKWHNDKKCHYLKNSKKYWNANTGM